MRRLILLCSIALLLAWSEAAQGQAQAARDSGAGGAPRGLCYRARPRPACSAFVLTNVGSYVVLGSKGYTGGIPLRAVADWGLMFNVSTRDAIGASFFASSDLAEFSLGPALRYRRWLGSSQSVEVAVGAPLPISTGPGYYGARAGSLFGLVKWSPNHWFAIAARPELVHQRVSVGCPTNCRDEVQSRVRLSLGAEMGEVPGTVLTAAAPLLTFLAFLVAYHGSN